MSDEEERLKQGAAAVRASQWERAQQLFEEALAGAQKNQNLAIQARALYSLGGLFQTLRQYPKSQGYARQALEIFQGLKDRSGEADALNDLGSLARFLGKPDEALGFFDRALAIRQELGDTRREAETRTNIGNVYGTIGEYTKAREHYQQALLLHQASGNARSEANTLSNLGTIYRLTGQFLAAQQQYERARGIREKLGDPAGVASSLYNLGVCYKATGEYLLALQLYQQALALQEPLKNKATEATTRAGIASAYAALSQPQKALPLYQEVLALRRTSGDRRGEATALSNLGSVYSATGEQRAAREHLQQALALYQEIKDRAGEADAWNALGTLLGAEGQYEEARAAYEHAQALYQQLGDASGEADALSNLGASALLLKQYAKALALCQEALPRHQQLRNPSSELRTWDTLGQALRALGQLPEALRAFQRAISLVEQLRDSLGALVEAKTQVLGANLPLYYRAIALLHQLGHDEEAFLLVQKTKGRALAEQSGLVRPELSPQLTPAEREQWGHLQEQATQLNQQLVTEGVQNAPGSKKRFEALSEQLQKIELQRATLSDQLALRHPALGRLRPHPPRASKEIAARLSADMALVELSLTEKPLAFVVTQKGLSVHSLLGDASSLVPKISALQSACQSDNKDTLRPTQALSQALLAPLARPLAGKKRLIFCPDGVLWDIPFALLCPQQTVSLAHSATLWQRPTDGARHKPTQEILVYANPDCGTFERFTLSPLLSYRPIKTPDRPIKTPDRDLADALDRKVLPALPGTDVEAQAIAKLFPRGVVRRGSAAQGARFLKEAGHFRTLHLASHAFLNNALPLLSCLVLAAPPVGSTGDGLLTAQDILPLELSAELVVLSACNTGRGEKQAGEGVIGLSWAFLVAGAQQLMVTQWSVNDAATAAFMQIFYQNRKAGKSPREALQRAQIALRKIPKWQHPHYWAPFYLIETSA